MPITKAEQESVSVLLARIYEQNEIIAGLLLMVIEKQYRPEKSSVLDDFRMEFNLTHLTDLRERFVPYLSGKQVRDGRMEPTCHGNGASNPRRGAKLKLFREVCSERTCRHTVIGI